MARRILCLGFTLLLHYLGAATLARATSGELYPYPDLLEQDLRGWDAFAESWLEEPRNGPPLGLDPVVTAVGEFVTWHVDLDLGGPLRLGFARHHGTGVAGGAASRGFQSFTASPMGGNWTHNFHYLLKKLSENEVAVLYERGSAVYFEKSAGVIGSGWHMVPPPSGLTYRGTPFQMVETESKLEMMDPRSRRIFTFEFASLPVNGVSKVEAIRDRNGNALTLTYGSNSQLLLVEDGLGRSLSFENTVISGFYRITRVTDQSGRSVAYAYSFPTLVSVTDARGGVTHYGNQSSFQLTSITRPEGNVVLQNTYVSGRVSTQTDGAGNLHSLSYGPTSATITDPLGNTRTHEFGAELRMIRFTDEAGNSIDYSYDPSHRLSSTTDRLGDVSALTYHDPSGYVASRTDNLGETWNYTYEAQVQDGFTFHVPTRVDYPDGTSTTLSHDARGNLVSVTDREGNTTLISRNARGQVETRINAEGGITSYTYHPDATLAARQDPSGNVTTYAYDAQKRVVSVELPDAASRSYTYDANDNVTSVTDENGHTTTYAYDANDNRVSATDPLGHETTYAYDGNDDVIAVVDPLGRVWNYTYDALQRLSSRTDPEGHTVTYGYDARRRLASVTNELGQVWSFTYDAEGVLATVGDPLGQTHLLFSDALGRITRIQDPLGYASETVYDALGRVVQEIDPLGRTTTYQRDGNGLVTGIDLAEPGVAAGYIRNGLHRIETVTDARGFAWQSVYDSQARRISRTDPLGNQFTFTYDDRSRVVQTGLPGGMGTIDYTYDSGGRLTEWSASDGTLLSYAYDADGRLTNATGVAMAYSARGEMIQCNGLEMAYGADGTLTSVTYEPGKTVTYAYDARGLLTTVTDWAGGVTSLVRDDEGRLASITHANGVVTSYTYDDADRLLGIVEGGPGGDGSGGTLLSSVELVRDGDGQITQAIRDTPLQAVPAPTIVSREYDAANRVVGQAYDPMGRLLDDGARSYVWNLADQLEGYTENEASIAFTRDAFGGVLSRTDDMGTREFVWNYALGLPWVAVEKRDGIVQGYNVCTPDGRLLYCIEPAGTASRGGHGTGGDPGPPSEDDTALERATSRDVRVVIGSRRQPGGGGERLHYHYDEMGSTLFLTDEAAQIVQLYAYDPYGQILEEAGEVANLFTHHGMYGVLREGGLLGMRARYYLAAGGRFLSADPILSFSPMAINPYQAFLGNPLRYVDPRGDQADDAGGGFWGGFWGGFFRGLLGGPDQDAPEPERGTGPGESPSSTPLAWWETAEGRAEAARFFKYDPEYEVPNPIPCCVDTWVDPDGPGPNAPRPLRTRCTQPSRECSCPGCWDQREECGSIACPGCEVCSGHGNGPGMTPCPCGEHEAAPGGDPTRSVDPCEDPPSTAGDVVPHSGRQALRDADLGRRSLADDIEEVVL